MLNVWEGRFWKKLWESVIQPDVGKIRTKSGGTYTKTSENVLEIHKGNVGVTRLLITMDEPSVQKKIFESK